MTGYPEGTRCVITWVPMDIATRTVIGDFVTCASATYWYCRDREGRILNQAAQRVLFERTGETWAWPIAWMRPIDGDIDARDHEVVSEYLKGSFDRIVERLLEAQR